MVVRSLWDHPPAFGWIVVNKKEVNHGPKKAEFGQLMERTLQEGSTVSAPEEWVDRVQAVHNNMIIETLSDNAPSPLRLTTNAKLMSRAKLEQVGVALPTHLKPVSTGEQGVTVGQFIDIAGSLEFDGALVIVHVANNASATPESRAASTAPANVRHAHLHPHGDCCELSAFQKMLGKLSKFHLDWPAFWESATSVSDISDTNLIIFALLNCDGEEAASKGGRESPLQPDLPTFHPQGKEIDVS